MQPVVTVSESSSSWTQNMAQQQQQQQQIDASQHQPGLILQQPAVLENNSTATVLVSPDGPASFSSNPLFLSRPASAAEAAAAATGSSSAQPSPAGAQQELQLHSMPAPVQEQRTIFVAGFPLDMTEREFHLLLTFLPGYEACQLSWGTGAPQGFALFGSNAEAASAVERLAGHQVEAGAVLRAEIAHKNLVIKKEAPPAAAVNGTQLTILGPMQPRAAEPQMVNSGLGLPYANMFHASAQPIMAQPGAEAPMALAGYNGMATAAGLSGSPSFMGGGGGGQSWRGALGKTRDNAPCNTLFIGNLGENTREEELHQLMASQPGFRQLKWSPTGKGIIAFVEYEDTATASYVHQALQGVVLPSNERGGIRIQFSKNPLGKRSPGDTTPNLHGLFAAPPMPHTVASAGMQAQALYNTGLVAPMQPMGMTTLAPPAGYLGAMEVQHHPHHAAAATAAAMAAAAAAAATQGMVGNTPLFGPVGAMLL